MAAINAQQIRKIYAIGNALGIVERGNEDDDLHALVSALTGKDSVKSLTYTVRRMGMASCTLRGIRNFSRSIFCAFDRVLIKRFPRCHGCFSS